MKDTAMDIETLRGLKAKATPGPWETEEDPTQKGDHATLVTLPGRAGIMGTWLACAFHNWNEAAAGERRISWKEAESNASLIVYLVNSIPAIEALIEQNRLLKSEADENARIIGVSAERELQLIERVRVLESKLTVRQDLGSDLADSLEYMIGDEPSLAEQQQAKAALKAWDEHCQALSKEPHDAT